MAGIPARDRLSEVEAAELRAFYDRHGERHALELLKVNTATLMRCLARAPIQRPTATMIRLLLPSLRTAA